MWNIETKTNSLKQLRYLRIFSILLIVFFVAVMQANAASNSRSFNQLLEKAQKKNQREAQFLLGKTYENGNDVKRDTRKAIYWYKKAANRKHTNAQYKLAILYYKLKQYKKARYWLEKRSRSGNADSQFHYANTYRYGLGTRKKLKSAHYWYLKSARKGHPQAQFELGLMYQRGLGVRKDRKIAAKWFARAAKKSHKQAKRLLKTTTKSKTLVAAQTQKKKISQAKISKPIDRIIMSGSAEEQFQRAIRYIRASSSDKTQAVKLLEIAAKQNHPYALYHLGNTYWYGKIKSQDISKAIYYYTLASKQNIPAAQTALNTLAGSGFHLLVNAEAGNKQSQYSLALDYLKKSNPAENQKGIMWLEKAANQDHIESLLMLGDIYLKGKITAKDDTKAFTYVEKAANLNNSSAQFILSKMYAKGIGTPSNQSLSAKWLNRAANLGDKNAQKALKFSEI